MTEPMTPQRREEIRRILGAVTTDQPTGFSDRDRAWDQWAVHSREYAADLLAEVDRLTARLRELAFAEIDANELRQRSRSTNDVARQLADKIDELNTLRAEFDEHREICSEHCSEYDGNEVRLEDQISKLTARVAELEAERDEARRIARTFRGIAADQFDNPPHVLQQIGLDAQAPWLTATDTPTGH